MARRWKASPTSSGRRFTSTSLTALANYPSASNVVVSTGTYGDLNEFTPSYIVTAGGRIFYVANAGSDSNNGTSPSAPWKTVAHVNTQSYLPGDSILFNGGDTWREIPTLSNVLADAGSNSNGTAVLPITIGSYGTGRAKFNAGDVVSGTWVNLTSNDTTGQESGGIFACGFETETNNFNVQMTGKSVHSDSTPNTVVVDGTAATHGTKGMHVTIADSAPYSYAFAYKNITAVGEIYARVYVTMVNDLDPNGNNLYILQLQPSSGGGGTPVMRVGVTKQGGTYAWNCLVTVWDSVHSVWATTQVATSAPVPVVGSSYCVEIHYKADASGSTGVAELWINGTNYGSKTGLATNGGNVASVCIGATNYTTNTAPILSGQIYFDDLKLDSAYIGPYPFYGPNLWQCANVLAVNDGITSVAPNAVWFNGTPGIGGQSSSCVNYNSTLAQVSSGGANNWMWTASQTQPTVASNVLTVYSSGTPSNIEISSRRQAMRINGCSYITINNVELLHSNSENLALKTNFYCTVENCLLHDSNCQGILIWSDTSPYSAGGHTIQHNEIYNSGISRITGGNGSALQSLSKPSQYGCDTQNIIQYNYIHDVYGDGHDHGYYLEATGGDQVRYNYFLRCVGDAVKFNGPCPSTTMGYYNLCVQCGNGVAIVSGGSGQFFNNTLIDCGRYPGVSPYTALWYQPSILPTGDPSLSTGVFKNNIVYGSSANGIGNGIGWSDAATTSGLTSDYNLFFNVLEVATYGALIKTTLANWQAACGQDAHSLGPISGSLPTGPNPLFVSALTGDYRLRLASPCVDAGANVGLVVDYNGNVVPYGAGVDLGCYELTVADTAEQNAGGGGTYPPIADVHADAGTYGPTGIEYTPQLSALSNWMTIASAQAAIAANTDAVDMGVSFFGIGGTGLNQAALIAALSSFVTEVVAEVSSHPITLPTGLTLVVGPTALTTPNLINVKVLKNSTVPLSARVILASGVDAVITDISAIQMTIFQVDDVDPDLWTPINGQINVPLTPADVMFDSILTDALAANYNFRHVPDVSVYPAFEHIGTPYAVVYQFTPTVPGQLITARFSITVV